MNEQARRSSPPNRVRLPTDRQFASGCSPRRLGANAVTFGYGVVAYSDTDFHRADVAPSRAHDSRFRGNDGRVGPLLVDAIRIPRLQAKGRSIGGSE
jgi:hypothetical protein